jgi:tetratricopeptide (TPR) repeat protein
MVLALKADHVRAVAAKVSVFMAQNQPAKALSFLENKLRQHEKNTQLAAVLHGMRGNVLLSGKDYEQSEAAFKKAIDLHPDLVAPYLNLATLYLANKKTTEAIALYEQILEKQPKFLQVYMALGNIYEAEGNKTKARKMYEKALEIDPNFGPAANNLAWMLLEQGEDPDRAFDLAKTAKAQLPDAPGVADTLGLALIIKGLYTSAISELRDAATKMPQNPTVVYHLGLAYWKSGDKDRAMEALRKALSVKDTFPERQAAGQLLKEIEGS